MTIQSWLAAVAIPLSVTACPTANAGEATGTVTRLVTRDSDGLLYVHLSVAPTSRASCASNSDYWIIPNENSESGKKLYALLLSAQLSERVVRIVGKNTCTRWADGEDINYVILM